MALGTGEFVAAMAAAGVDLFDCSTEEFWHPAFPEEHPTRTLAGWTELLSGVPSAAGGSVGSNCTMGPTPSYMTDVADHYTHFVRRPSDCDLPGSLTPLLRAG